MRIVITGATGLLGRNLLFEFLKKHISDHNSLEVILLGRDAEDQCLFERVNHMLLNDGCYYIFDYCRNERAVNEIPDYIKIKCINAELDFLGLGLSKSDLEWLLDKSIDIFFHIAGRVDFRDSPKVVELLQESNVKGTQRVIDLVDSLNVKKLVYVSSAYSCGLSSGILSPDYINFNQKFRNPYEISKLKGEVLIRRYAANHKMRCHIFRPSTICGRLIEKPLGATPKFDVFYEWAAFFLRIKLKELGVTEDLYHKPYLLDNFRCCYSSKSGLNIVPADFAAKVMYEVCVSDRGDIGFHLVNEKETFHAEYTKALLSSIGIDGIWSVDEVPEKKTPLEALYYRHVGKIFTPYVTSEPMLFDTRNLEDVYNNSSLTCPPIDSNALEILIEYAKQYHFGIDLASYL